MQAETAAANVVGLGRYRLRHRIAVGGMAEVFEALDTEGDTPVVVKILLPDLCLDADVLQMFADEAKLTTTIAHENLVRTFDTGESDGRPFIVMEFVDGCTLNELVRRGGPLPLCLATRVAHDVLKGLCYLHGCSDDAGKSLHVVHRDVNPRNVLISRQGEVKLADFGIAQWRMRAARTRSGVIKGTVQYMSPEQITGSDPDHRADLYGVGLVLFEMLTGHPYIEAENEMELLRLAESPPWRPASRLRTDLPEAIDGVLQPALMRFPEQRYRNASAFVSALTSTMESLEHETADAEQLGAHVNAVLAKSAEETAARRRKAAAPALSPRKTIPATTPPLERPPSRFRLRVVGWALGLLVASGVGVWIWQANGLDQSSAGSAGARPNGQAPDQPAQRTLRQTRPGARDVPSRPSTDDDPARGSTPPTARSATPTNSPRPQLVGLGRPSHRAPTGRDRGRQTRPSSAARPAADRPRPKDSGPPTPAAVDASRPNAEVERLRSMRRQVLSSMQRKEVGLDDLGPGARGQLVQARRALDQGDLAAAEAALNVVAAEVATLAVDQMFVRKKLQRVDRKLRALPADRSDVKQLRQQSTEAIQAFMDGNYQQANRQLNRILQLLR